MKTKLKESSREHWLDFVRILAVFLVIWAHLVDVTSYDKTSLKLIFGDVALPIFSEPLSIAFWENPLLYRGSSAGSVGVTLFFITSGYLMAGMSRRYSRKNFLLNRTFRIFPTLWFFVFLVAIMQSQLGLEIGKSQILVNMFLLTGLIPKAALIGITWTLILEMYFYFLTSIVGKWTTSKVLLISAALFFVHEIFSKPGINLVNVGPISFDVRRLLMNISLYFLIMLIGTAVATSKEAMTPVVVFCMALIALGDSKRVNKDWLGWDWNLASIIISFLVFMLVYLISTLKSSIFSWGVFGFFGDIVYPLYLFHIPIGIGSMLILRDVISSEILLLISSLFFVILFSWISHLFIEKPGIRLGRRILSQK